MHQSSKRNNTPRQSTLLKVFKEEKYFSKEDPNQQELRITEMAGFNITGKSSDTRSGYNEFVNIKKDIFLKTNGEAHIIFDVWKLKKYTCAIANPNATSVWYTVEISPDNGLFTDFMKRTEIEATKLDIVQSSTWLRYLKILFSGEPGMKIVVYMQGVRD